MASTDRTPCINPRCRRTGPADKFPGEMICGKCFRTLPVALRQNHRRCWREIRKWQRRITRTSDELKIARMRGLVNKWAWRLEMNWRRIRAAIIEPEKPMGLDAFMDEVGL